MKYYSTLKYSFYTLRKFMLTGLLAVVVWVSYGQQSNLISNEYTPLHTGLLSGLTVASSETCVSFLCTDDFTNKGNIINTNHSDNASWNSVLGGTVWIEVHDPNASGAEVYPAGSYAGFVIGNDGLLDILGNTTITTYLGGTEQENVSGNSLLSLGLLTTTARVGFISSMPFDRI